MRGFTLIELLVTMGIVGWGMQGPGNTHEFLNLSDCQVVAACDLDKNHLQAAVDSVSRSGGAPGWGDWGVGCRAAPGGRRHVQAP